ncbi:MAG: hypothetical protein LC101_01850 [Flavobacteriales bacterium]|jgi:hypothetical protein|nr:hypothetical protein [Flavobacteriales bacterium]HOR10620.1 hypothetical protein [Bacteroidales bacterium]
MITKNFYDRSVPTRNLITTITGIVLMAINLIVSILLAAGKVTPEQAPVLTDTLGQIVTISSQLIGYISAIILMFKSTDA